MTTLELDQRLLAAIDLRRIRDDLDQLARFSLLLGGTEQEHAAARYVCERLREDGVEVRLEQAFKEGDDQRANAAVIP